MKFLMKQLKSQWLIILVLLVSHIFRAHFTLLLPSYTSDLVDVGIQNSGFEYAVPLAMNQDDYAHLSPLLSQEESETLATHYYQDNRGNYVLHEAVQKDDVQMQALQNHLIEAMALYQESDSLPQEAYADRDAAYEQLVAYGENHVHNLGVQTALSFYRNAGYNPHDIQVRYLLVQGSIMVGIALITVMIEVFAFYLSSILGANVGKQLRSETFDKVLHFGETEINQFSTASLITRTTNDIQQVQMTIAIWFRGAAYAPFLALGGMYYVLNTQKSMAWILAVGVGVVFGLIAGLMALTMPKYQIVQKLFDKVNLIAREVLTGLQVIRAFGRQGYETKRFDQANEKLQGTHLFTGRVMSLIGPTITLVMDITSIFIVWFAAQNIASGTMQVGDMMAYITYSMQVMFGFLIFAGMSMQIPRALISLNRVREVIETSISIHEPHESVVLEDVAGVVSFNDVSFTFNDAEEPSLEHIDFTARPGETTAIIGSTGSGKSTILNLLMRFHDVSEGSITIDGVDIRQLSLRQLRDLIGYVPQRAVLFSGTIASNIGYGVENLSEPELERAAQIAHAEEFIQGKAQGYDAPISQGGSNVSGGQKQRLSIARAIAKDPEIYIFDDSFSALDYRTDRSLRQVLKEEVSDATLIIVAQRISTILDADQIIVLDEGRVDGIGTHEELLESSSVYREIASSQLSEEELAQTSDANESEIEMEGFDAPKI
ncbi:ABC transporter [Suicoccus acidiformans]|uniref:ABC transporter n=1 Tax=Suicoccus acidiformans TaxID=2036206 RepID=A0A347WNF7_9LACT|nr:ABC transporter ATP-binding protein [Suicoccus acidiformans]AXY26614.1 ABC transporter [Suicoccus acidiformans]